MKTKNLITRRTHRVSFLGVNILSLVITISLVFCSCQEDEETNKQQQYTSNSISKSFRDANLFEVYNSQNPFDIVGVRHNTYLDIIGHVLANQLGDSLQNMINLTDEQGVQSCINALNTVITTEINENGDNYTEEELSFLRSCIANTRQYEQMCNSMDNSYYLLSTEFTTNTTDTMVSRCYVEMQTLFNNWYNGIISMDNLFDYMTSLENYIIRNGSHHNTYSEAIRDGVLPADEILISISVLKHSLVYWNDATNNVANIWNCAITNVITQMPMVRFANAKTIFSFFKNAWKKTVNLFHQGVEGITAAVVKTIAPIVAFDLGGAKVGTLFGGVAGAVAGAALGSAVGATIGAITVQQ